MCRGQRQAPKFPPPPPLLTGMAADDPASAARLMDGDDPEPLRRLLLRHPQLASAPIAPRRNTLLHVAVSSRLVQCALMLARHDPALVTIANADNRTPLHLAADTGLVEVVPAFLRAAPEAALQLGRGGQTPLMAAVCSHRWDIAELLLRAQPSAAMQPDLRGMLPLHQVALDGRHKMLLSLLKAAPQAARVRCLSYAWLPLHNAASKGRPTFVKSLLAAAPDTIDVLDNRSESPLSLTASSGNKTCVAMLATPELLQLRDVDGMTPLHHAAQLGHAKVVEYLLAAAPATATTVTRVFGDTPLHKAVGGPADADGCAECVRLLVAAAPGTAAVADSWGNLPIHAAARRGYCGSVRALVAAAPATVTATDMNKQKPLQLAVAGQHWATVGTLLLAMLRCVPRPLTDDEWLLVPRQHPDLLPSLPAALQLSTAQAKRVMHRLSPAARSWVRLVVLALSSGKPSARPSLPPEMVDYIIGKLAN